MPEFNYTAVTGNGRVLEGHREAENVKRLTALLAQEGLELVNA
jgi:type II secretory pathway component PulF